MESTIPLKTELNNYKMVDIFKYIAAILVICIHCGQIVPQEYVNFFIKNIIGRVAVPFFFISSAFFIRRGSQNNSHYVKGYLNRLMKSYLLWSLVFIPIGLDWIHQNLDLSGSLLPFALLFGLVHIGTYYHLWYIPAMLFSVFFVDKLLKRFSYKSLFIISLLLFLFGSLETYYGLLPIGGFKDFFDLFIKIIFTTRSGLFFGMIFILIGFYIYDNQDKIKLYLKYIPILTLVFGGLLIAEGFLLYNIPKLDMNFLVMLIPFSFCFFIWVLSLPHFTKLDTTKIRELSKYYYFVHPICIVLVEEMGKAFHLNLLSFGVVSFLLIIFLTHILSQAIIQIQKGRLNYTVVIFAALAGIVITFILASLFYQLKPDNSLIKFEWVPCLWLFSSFIMYYLLIQRKTIHSS